MKIIILILTVFLSFGASATRLPDMNRFGVNQTGNSAKIGAVGPSTGWGSEIPISPTPGGWSYAGNYGIPQAASGPTMNLGHSGDVFFSGTKYPFQAGYTISGATLVDAIGVISGGPIAIGLFALPFMMDWLSDSGGRIDPNDPTKMQRTDTSVCTVAPCYLYTVTSTAKTDYLKPSILEACTYWAAHPDQGITSASLVSVSGSTCTFHNNIQNYNFQLSASQTSVAPSSSSWLPSSMDDISPYMKQTPFDPRVIKEILDKGGDIPFPQPTISGPSEILGPKTESPNPDGSTTVTQPRSRFTISGDTITNTTNETTVTVVNVDNSIRSTSTSVVTLTESTGAPEKSEDPCISNPERIGCIKVGEPTEPEQLEKVTVPVEITPVVFAGSGSCPSPLSFSVSGHSYSVSYDPLCEKLAILKYLFLAMAGFIASWVVASLFKV